ncbi:MAG: hypothetical protein AB4042_16175 [Leptolyngbyaceae cyanobacterium]
MSPQTAIAPFPVLHLGKAIALLFQPPVRKCDRSLSKHYSQIDASKAR